MFEKLHFVSSLSVLPANCEGTTSSQVVTTTMGSWGFFSSSSRYCGISKFSFMGQIAFTLCSLEVAEMIWILGQDWCTVRRDFFGSTTTAGYYTVVLISAKPWHVGKKKKDRGHACKAASTGILRGQKASKLRRLHAVSFSLITVAFSEAILCLSRKDQQNFKVCLESTHWKKPETTF